jgi:hypothetical protein
VVRLVLWFVCHFFLSHSSTHVDDLSKESLPKTHNGGTDGCRVKGTLHINRVKGEFHIAFGRQALANSGESSLQRSHVRKKNNAKMQYSRLSVLTCCFQPDSSIYNG